MGEKKHLMEKVHGVLVMKARMKALIIALAQQKKKLVLTLVKRIQNVA